MVQKYYNNIRFSNKSEFHISSLFYFPTRRDFSTNQNILRFYNSEHQIFQSNIIFKRDKYFFLTLVMLHTIVTTILVLLANEYYPMQYKL